MTSTTTLKQRIQDDVKTAMRERNKPQLAVLRLMTAQIKQREVDSRIEMQDADIIAELDKMIKQRKESHKQYIAGNREDLAEQEAFEMTIIEKYLPEPLPAEEVAKLINAAMTETNASGMQDMGKVMAILKPQVQGRADMSAISRQIKDRLSAS